MRSRSGASQLVVVTVLAIAMGACAPVCGIGAHLTLSNARVDSSFNCPNPAENLPYKVHGTIDMDNYTNNSVTIKSMSETNVTVAIHGKWTGALGQKGKGPITDFTPKSIAAGSKDTLHFSIPFICTNSGPTVSTYGDFSFKFKVVTSAGTFNLDGANQHRIVAA